MNDSTKNNIKIIENGFGVLAENESQENKKLQWENIKKSIIYFLMSIACLGCLYLIFKPKDKMKMENAGINSAIPQAADDKLQPDKQKAYEQQLLEQKNGEKRNSLTSLSDYWSDPGSANNTMSRGINGNSVDGSKSTDITDQNAVSSYRNAQQTLGSFYSRDDQEINTLKQEINRLKNESSRKDAEPRKAEINEQLELMEKSYQMAAKYLPLPVNHEKNEEHKITEPPITQKKIQVTTIMPDKQNLVSCLYRQMSDSIFLTELNHNKFHDIEQNTSGIKSRNSIRAVIYETKIVTQESFISLRLLETMLLGKSKIPSGSILKAYGKFQGGRLLLKISTIEYNGNLQKVEIDIHDNDGQLGLNVPYSPEQNAMTDILANMGQTSGTNIMMTQSAQQQIAADLTKGAIQGISGYFQKKIKLPKVTVKAGHQVFLISKKS